MSAVTIKIIHKINRSVMPDLLYKLVGKYNKFIDKRPFATSMISVSILYGFADYIS